MMDFSDPVTALCLYLLISVPSEPDSVEVGPSNSEVLPKSGPRLPQWHLRQTAGFKCIFSELRGFVLPDLQHPLMLKSLPPQGSLFLSRWPNFLSTNRTFKKSPWPERDLLHFRRKVPAADSMFSKWYKNKFPPLHPTLVYWSVKFSFSLQSVSQFARALS